MILGLHQHIGNNVENINQRRKLRTQLKTIGLQFKQSNFLLLFFIKLFITIQHIITYRFISGISRFALGAQIPSPLIFV